MTVLDRRLAVLKPAAVQLRVWTNKRLRECTLCFN